MVASVKKKTHKNYQATLCFYVPSNINTPVFIDIVIVAENMIFSVASRMLNQWSHFTSLDDVTEKYYFG